MCKLPRSRKSPMAQFRLEILPLKIETYMYGICMYGMTLMLKIIERERVCKLCNAGECEDEIHFMFACPLLYRLYIMT